MLIFLAYFRFSLYLYSYERASYGYIKSITRHDGRNAIVAWNCQPAVCRDYQIEPVRCQTKVHNCKCSYLCCSLILLFSEILLLPQFRSIIPCEVLLYIEVTFLGFIHWYKAFWCFLDLSKHKIPHPNQWGSMKNHKKMMSIQWRPQRSRFYLYIGSERSAFQCAPILQVRWQNAG